MDRGRLDGLEPFTRVALSELSWAAVAPRRVPRGKGTLSVSKTAYERMVAAATARRISIPELVERALDGFDGHRMDLSGFRSHAHEVRADSSPIGESIRAFRLARGWSQIALGGRIGVIARRISMWELGRQRPRARHVAALVALGFELPTRQPPAIPVPAAVVAQRDIEGTAIRTWRMSLHQSMTRLAIETGIHASTLSRLENGRATLSAANRQRLVALGFRPPKLPGTCGPGTSGIRPP